MDIAGAKRRSGTCVNVPSRVVVGRLETQYAAFDDYIITLDNKSITHRPDMWGHRGFAREVAAILGICHLSLQQNFYKIDYLDQQKKKVTAVDHDPLSVSIDNQNSCKSLAALYCPYVDIIPSCIAMALRLARVDSKPINAVV